jgi:hypothetical protein
MKDDTGIDTSPASHSAAVVSGAVGGLVVVLIGYLAGELGEPLSGNSLFGPSVPALAAAMAAAVSSYKAGSSIGAALVVAIGAFLVTYLAAVWLTHWMGVGGMVRRRPVDPAVLGWRRDLGVCFLGIAVGSFLGTFLGRR